MPDGVSGEEYIDDQDMLDELDPMGTPFNSLSRFGQGQSSQRQQPQCSPRLLNGLPPLRTSGPPTPRASLCQQPRNDPCFGMPAPNFQHLNPEEEAGMVRFRASASSVENQMTMSRDETSPSVRFARGDTVVIVDNNGVQTHAETVVTSNNNSHADQTVDVTAGTDNNNTRVAKKKQKPRKVSRFIFFFLLYLKFFDFQKDEVDAASNYYNMMKKEQTEVMKLKRKVLKSKLRTEKMKQALIQHRLEENNVQLPEMEGFSDSSSNSSSSEEES